MEISTSGQDNKPSKLTKRALTAAAVVVGSLALSACSFNPKNEKAVSRLEAKEKAVVRYDKAFQKESPAGKFVVQYLGRTRLDVRQFPHAQPDSNAGTNDPNYIVKFNNGCLFNTAYDISGGTIKGTFNIDGLFTWGSGSVSGNVPTAAAYAEVNPQNKNQLIIESGHSDSVSLLLNGLEEGSSLVPANAQTTNILYTYGCETGITSSHLKNLYD